jgi:phosphoglycerate kinase
MIKSVTSVKVTGRRVVMRAGFDVPLKQSREKETFEVADENRIKDALPTIEYLIKQKAKIVIISHLGRPKGEWVKEKSMWPVAHDLARLLKRKAVKVSGKLPTYNIPHIYFFESDITKKDYSGLVKKLKEGDILFLENMRFYKGEEDNDKDFVETLAAYGEVYVNDAFSVAHRKEASTYGVAQKLKPYAGVSLLNEIKALDRVLKNPQKPMVVVMGGAKIADKVDTIHALAKHAQYVCIGGAIANAFIAAKGYEIGKSKVAEVPLAKELMRDYKSKIVLPVDVVVAKNPKDHARVVPLDKIRSDDCIYDIGPKTVSKFSELIKEGKTLVWNGPMGLIEEPKFTFGSKAIAHIFAWRAKGPAFGVVGGGESVEVVHMAKVAEFIDHVSTGGGAMLEYLGGKTLPGIKVLDHK